MNHAIRTAGRFALPVSLTLAFGVVSPAMADAERLEADLQALFGPGTLEIGDISEGMIRNRTTAESIRFDGDEGERLLIDRYVVSGDYDQPDEVTLEGIRVEDSLSDLMLMSIERVIFGEPAQAVLPGAGALTPQALRLGSLAIDDIVIELASEFAGEFLGGTPMAGGSGRLTIDSVRGDDLSHQAIGLLDVTGIAGAGSDLGELGQGSFTLASLRLEGLRGLDAEGDQSLDSLALSDFVIESDQLVGSLSRLTVDGDVSDGEGGLRLEDFSLDLAKMIDLAPEEERTQLRMVSNVLTDGSGTLRLDAAFLGNWEEGSDHSRIHSESHVTAHDAVRLLVDIDLPLALPVGAQPADVFADSDLLEDATLLGGDIRLIIGDEGLFGRLATLGAAMGGVTEAQYLEQARTQAQGFGVMFGPQIQTILMGLVALLEGSASELEIAVGLPAESNLATYTGDPLGLPDKLSINVQTR
ncbi:MAG: hypothetical protein LC652_13655 [Halomonas sp.]|nr:hypothetical protein [Halomonas sp.]